MGEISRRKRHIHARSVCNNFNLDFLFNLEASAPIKKTRLKILFLKVPRKITVHIFTKVILISAPIFNKTK